MITTDLFTRTRCELAAGADAEAPDSLKLELIGRPVFDPATVYKKK